MTLILSVFIGCTSAWLLGALLRHVMADAIEWDLVEFTGEQEREVRRTLAKYDD